MTPHPARKRFGQHFLADQHVISRIISCVGVRYDDPVIEIGPGLAALTAPLLARLAHLYVVEIDRELIDRLRRQYAPEQLTIYAADALTFDFARLASEVGAPLRVVGNLPYNISTPLLFHLAAVASSVCDMHLMLQKEVVDRMVAEPGNTTFGRLSVMLQYHFVIERLLDVSPEAFKPPPRVQSAVVRLFPRQERAISAIDVAQFAAVVATAFAQRRKMLRNSLRGLLGERDLAELGISQTARAEELSVADYVRLANHLQRDQPCTQAQEAVADRSTPGERLA